MSDALTSLWRDTRFAARAIRREPRFAGVAVAGIAIGLAAAIVVFSVVDHVVLRPLSFAAPERLVVIRETIGDLRDVYPTVPANAAHFLAWRRACRSCEELAAIRRADATLTGRGDPVRLGVVRVSTNLFSLLGVQPVLGRGFMLDEDDPGRDHVVVISDGFWRRVFGADRTVLGRSIILDREAYQVVGVLPPGLSLPPGDALGPLANLPHQVDVYRPLALTAREATMHGQFDYVVLARLRAGASAERVRRELDAILAPFANEAKSTITSAVVSVRAQVVGPIGRPLLLLLAAVVGVLVVICLNLANLVLARNVSRRREASVRIALGAARMQLARLATLESLLLTILGAMVGLLLARWLLRVVVASAPPMLPRIAQVQLDVRAFVAVAVMIAFVTMVIGVLPTLGIMRVNPGEVLRSGGRTATQSRDFGRYRPLFIAFQVACSTVLLIGTGLLLSSFVRVLRTNRGFDDSHVLALYVALPGSSYRTDAARRQFYRRAIDELRAIRGVSHAAVASALPLSGESWVEQVAPDDRSIPTRDLPNANLRFVSPAYFTTIGTPLRRGSDFVDADETRSVAIVSERTARTLWPNGSAIGQRLTAGNLATDALVIAVAADVHTSSLEQEGSLVVYLPFWKYFPAQASVIVRTTGDPAATTNAARSALSRADPTVPIVAVRTMASVVSDAVSTRRFEMLLLAILATVALTTAAIGIYGVITQWVVSRTSELAIRMALGARAAHVHALVLREGLVPIAAGVVVGMAAALAGSRAIESLLYEVRPVDPITYACVAALLAAVGIVASAVPAWRATRTGLAEIMRLQ